MSKGNKNRAIILIADDEAGLREILSRKLSGGGYTCITAANGNEALEMLKVHIIDLVLLDIKMPGKTGIEVLNIMQKKYSDTVVIMVTAIADVQIAIDAMKAGAYDYIIKPVDLSILNISIERALERRRLIQENRNYQLYLENKIKEQTDKIRESFLNSTKSLAYALEAKDRYTSGHSQRVTKVAIAIAREMGLSEEMIEKIGLAGMLHDIGKIGVMEAVLNKQGRLSAGEYEHVKEHCEMGERILMPIVEDSDILEMVRHHHERYDGKGYPDGISAMQLSLGAEILAVADSYTNILSKGAMALALSDAYDAMTSNRPYRRALSHEEACDEIMKGRGTQFAPEVVDAFLEIKHTIKSIHNNRLSKVK
jgi:putative two-component system response regulator